LCCVTNDIPAPMNVKLQRSGDDTILEVSWSAIDLAQISSYDVEYRAYQARLPALPSTIVNLQSLSLTITGLDGDINYEARVRGLVEIPNAPNKLVATTGGTWSPWVVSQVKPNQGKILL